ncbi:hypothetical protein GO495_21515 [Chitinophaga oryziterrae]|uniref:Uncharacterized protein n=1 Tax=Chitinophaga oryziterrae TaxID=1031224 RepID=A0A6N8JD98_9BACT|nr:hypothetical protein [Chitinophaga oryziterrae]MVT43190.1 hypothetical protein [Chitinophaga oryziterrae]
MTLPALKQDLIDSWMTAYDEYATRKEMKDTSVKMVYVKTVYHQANERFLYLLLYRRF